MSTYRARDTERLRVLFCVGVSQAFFDADEAVRVRVIEALTAGFDDLQGRFGVDVLGTMDDDELVVGPSTSWPWTAYILADAPDLSAVAAVCNLVRETPVGDDRLWRFMRIEARVGRRLFFGNA